MSVAWLITKDQFQATPQYRYGSFGRCL